jgi:membrane protein YdbS with pleckstrin-like domain
MPTRFYRIAEQSSTTMSEREAEDWLIRYLVVMVVAATALLMLIYGLVFAPSMALTAGALVALAVVSAVIIIDLRSWRTA